MLGKKLYTSSTPHSVVNGYLQFYLGKVFRPGKIKSLEYSN